VSNTGKLGMVLSSVRYKRDIHDMDTASSKLLKLRPVTFVYKQDPQGERQYGLIAEGADLQPPEHPGQPARRDPFHGPRHGRNLTHHGSAELTTDPIVLKDLAARGKPAQLAIRVSVHEYFFHCAGGGRGPVAVPVFKTGLAGNVSAGGSTPSPLRQNPLINICIF
jgi:hypothetical protein